MAIVVIGVIIAALVGIFMWVLYVAQQKAAELWVQIVRLMETAPTDPRTHQQVLTLFSQMTLGERKNYTERLYQAALAIVEENPGNIKCRVFALETGRLHHGLHRPDGKVTTYDEQAIQNDILARSGDAPKAVAE